MAWTHDGYSRHMATKKSQSKTSKKAATKTADTGLGAKPVTQPPADGPVKPADSPYAS